MSKPATSEETPFLSLNGSKSLLHDQIYFRFSPARKWFILVIVSMVCSLSFSVGGTFMSLILQVSEDIGAPATTVSLAVSISIFSSALGSFVGSTYSTYYGRRPIYLFGLPLLAITSFGAGRSRSIGYLFLWRFLQAFGAGTGTAIGSAVIGDVFKLEERGAAMGAFNGVGLIGPTLAPIVGGVIAHNSSWRVVQHCFGICTAILFLCVFLFFPETMHPGERGLNKLKGIAHPKWRPVFLNPFRPIHLLAKPSMLFVSTIAFTAVLTDYALHIPLPYTLSSRYGIINEAVIGAWYIPFGIGGIFGTLYSGWLSDELIKAWTTKRGGRWCAEDRLRAAIPGALLIIPVSMIASGIVVTYVPGSVGLGLLMMSLFITGFGVEMVLGPCMAYCVDIMHSRSAEAVSAYRGFRQLLTALSVTLIMPTVEKHGNLVADIAAAIIAWLGFLMLWFTIEYGHRLNSNIETSESCDP